MSETKEISTQTNDEDIDINTPVEFKNKIDSKLHKTIFNKSIVKNVILNEYVVENFRYFLGTYYSILHKIIMLMGIF